MGKISATFWRPWEKQKQEKQAQSEEQREELRQELPQELPQEKQHILLDPRVVKKKKTLLGTKLFPKTYKGLC